MIKNLCKTILLLSVSSGAWAVGEPVPHIFSNGTPADANQVNENFQELADRIVAIPVGPQGPIGLPGEQGPPGPQGEQGPPGTALETYNYLDYSHNFSSKTFERSTDGILIETETRTYDRSTPNALVVHRHKITNSTPAYEDFSTAVYTVDEDGLRMAKYLTYDTFDINNPATNNPILIDEINPPLLMRKTSMVIGVSWGSFGTLRREWLSQPASIEESYLSRTFTMLGVESVTVRDTSYNNCIRIHNNTDIPVSPYPSKSVQWYCEGFGLVKTVSSSSTQIFDGTTLVTSVKTTVLELVATKP